MMATWFRCMRMRAQERRGGGATTNCEEDAELGRRHRGTGDHAAAASAPISGTSAASDTPRSDPNAAGLRRPLVFPGSSSRHAPSAPSDVDLDPDHHRTSNVPFSSLINPVWEEDDTLATTNARYNFETTQQMISLF